MIHPNVVGPRLYLRPVELEDVPHLQRWINDPEVNRTLETWRPMNALAEREFVERVTASPTDVAWLIARRADDRPLGITGLHQIDWRTRQATFGILIGEPAEWGKGHGTEATALAVKAAFATLNLNRVSLLVYDANPRAARAYARVGFRREGVLREHWWKDGRGGDTVAMAILRREWDPAAGLGGARRAATTGRGRPARRTAGDSAAGESGARKKPGTRARAPR